MNRFAELLIDLTVGPAYPVKITFGDYAVRSLRLSLTCKAFKAELNQTAWVFPKDRGDSSDPFNVHALVRFTCHSAILFDQSS